MTPAQGIFLVYLTMKVEKLKQKIDCDEEVDLLQFLEGMTYQIHIDQPDRTLEMDEVYEIED